MSDQNGAQTGAPQQPMSIADRIAAQFMDEGEPPNEQPQGEPPGQEVAAQDADVAEDVTPDDIGEDGEYEESEPQTAAPQEFELTWRDEVVKVSADEAKNLAQLGYHVQKARDAVEQDLNVAQASAKQINHLVQQIYQTGPQIPALQSQMQALDMLAGAKGLNPHNILEVSRTDPARGQEMQAEYNVMVQQYNALGQQLQQAQQQFDVQFKQLNQERRVAEAQRLLKLNPNLKDPVQQAKAKEILGKHMSNWRPDAVEIAMNNAEVLDMLIDGAKYRNLQATKREKLTTATQSPRVVKPGASNQMSAEVKQDLAYRKAMKAAPNSAAKAKLIEQKLTTMFK